jgi:putative Mg2+ transporter-C (MgtC) family protein
MLAAAALPTLSPGELALRIVVAAALGGAVGFEREMRDQPAGFRTHMLVSLGSALFTLVGAYAPSAFLEGAGATVTLDPTRVAAQVVTGIGFLGAGAILRHGLSVRGLTTAAALWVTAAIGVAVGLGYWQGALFAVATTVVALYGMKRFERTLLHRFKPRRVTLRIEMEPHLRVADLAKALESAGARVESVQLRPGEVGDGLRHLVIGIGIPPATQVQSVLDATLATEGVAGVDWDA